LKMFYYRGLREWGHVNGYLLDTCLSAQDSYKALLDYFRIKYYQTFDYQTFDNYKKMPNFAAVIHK